MNEKDEREGIWNAIEELRQMVHDVEKRLGYIEKELMEP